MIGIQARVTAFLLLAVISLEPSSAAACRCHEPSVAAAYARAALVVMAETLEVRSRPDTQGDELKVRVLQAWKADAPATLEVVTGTDCAYSVRRGEKHLLFLVRAGEAFTTGRCMGNTPSNRSRAPLAWLRRHGKPAATATRGP
jgi:hypothetical protein